MTVYPAQIDDGFSLPPAIDNSTSISATSVNQLRSAIIAIESTLGTLPQSIYGTVSMRLNILEESIKNGSSIVFSNDLSGNSTSQTVIGIQNIPISSTVPLNGQALVYSLGKWTPTDVASSIPVATTTTTGTITLAGDISGVSTSIQVSKINGASVPTAGSLTAGNVLQVSGTSSLSYAPINLSNSASITGVLPSSNQAPQTLGGDLSGTTSSATVIKINGTSISASPSANQVLSAISSTASTWALVVDANISSSAAISGTKISSNFGSQTIQTTGQALLGPSAGSSVTTFTSITLPIAADSIYSYSSADQNNIRLISGSTTGGALVDVINTSGGASATVAVRLFAAGTTSGMTGWSNNSVIEQVGTSASSMIFARRDGANNLSFSNLGRIYQSGAFALGDASNNNTSSGAQAGLVGTLINIGAITSGTMTSASNQALIYNSAGTLILQGNSGVSHIVGTTTALTTSTSGITSPSVGIGTSSPPTITSGTGVPATTPSQGSLFLRTDGTSTTGIYTYQGGSWSTLAGSSNATQLQGISVSSTAPTTNQVLAYNGSSWIPASTTIGNVNGVGIYASRPGSPTSGDNYSATDGINNCIYDGYNWRPLINGKVSTEPLQTGWTSVNGSGITITTAGSISLLSSGTSQTNLMLYTQPLFASSNYTLIFAFKWAFFPPNGSNGNPIVGVGLRNSSSGSFVIANFYRNTSGTTDISNPVSFEYGKWTNTTTFSANYLSVGSNLTAAAENGVTWIKFVDDGTNRIASISADGIQWIQFDSHLRTDFITPDQYFIMNSQGLASSMTLIGLEHTP